MHWRLSAFFFVSVLASQVQAIARLAPVCADHAILRATYEAIGFIDGPSGQRTYLQVCEDGTFAYHTNRGELRTGTLKPEALKRLRKLLASGTTQTLPAQIGDGRGADFIRKLTIAIWRSEHYQLVTLDYSANDDLAPAMRALLIEMDALRPEAQFEFAPTFTDDLRSGPQY